MAKERVGLLWTQRDNLHVEPGNVGEIWNACSSSVFATKKDVEDEEFREGYVNSLKHAYIMKVEMIDIKYIGMYKNV